MDSQHNELQTIIQRFPGIGRRQAGRILYHLLLQNKDTIYRFTELLRNLKDETRRCKESNQFFVDPTGRFDTSPIARDPNRDTTLLMIITNESELQAVEASKTYNGLYYVLGYTTPLTLDTLTEYKPFENLSRVITEKKKILKEIIMGLPLNKEGEHTKDLLLEGLHSIIKDTDIRISSLGRGLSTGSELEYVDSETLKNALSNRTSS